MISNEEALNREASSFPGGTDITSIVDSLYSSLYHFAVGLTKSESEIVDALGIPIGTVMSRLSRGKVQLKSILWDKVFMAMVERNECGGQISQNAETCPHCADVIKEPKAKFSLVDLIHKVSVPVVLSIAGTMITILSTISMSLPTHSRKIPSNTNTAFSMWTADHKVSTLRETPERFIARGGSAKKTWLK